MKIVEFEKVERQIKNQAVRAFVDMGYSQAIEFEDYDEMRRAYWSIKGWLRGKDINFDVQQVTNGGFHIVKVRKSDA